MVERQKQRNQSRAIVRDEFVHESGRCMDTVRISLMRISRAGRIGRHGTVMERASRKVFRSRRLCAEPGTSAICCRVAVGADERSRTS